MRTRSLVAVAALLLAPAPLWLNTAAAHHVGNADYNDIGPCSDEYFYDPDDPESNDTDCWNVHGGLEEDELYYPEASDNMAGPSGPGSDSGSTGPGDE